MATGTRPAGEIVSDLTAAVLARQGGWAGDEIRFLCPIHENDIEHSPSARGNPEKATWFSDVCRGGGLSMCVAGHLKRIDRAAPSGERFGRRR